MLTGTGALELHVPRDRQTSFEPQLIAKYRRRFPDFDDKVVSLYARGMTTREIQGHLRELYGIEVSPDLISVVTDAVLEQVAEWQNRPLDALYALVFFDALRIKIRDEGTVRNKAVYLALGVRPDGAKEILGLWIEQTEGAKFWLRVMNELRNRGVADMLIAIVDGLKGGAGEGSVERSSMECRRRVPGGYQRRLPGGPDPDLHCPPDPPLAGVRVLEGAPRRCRCAEADLPRRQCRDRPRAAGRVRCRSLGKALPRHRARLAASVGAGGAVLCLPIEVRKIIYTTNAIESLHSRLRKAVRVRGHFPNEEAASKLLFLVLREVSQNWKMASREWNAARTQFAVMFGDRFIAE